MGYPLTVLIPDIGYSPFAPHSLLVSLWKEERHGSLKDSSFGIMCIQQESNDMIIYYIEGRES